MKALVVKPFYPRWMILVALKARCDVREINGPSDCICTLQYYNITAIPLFLYWHTELIPFTQNLCLYQSFDNLGENQALKR